MEKADIVIAGAGVVGLAIAAEISRKDREVIVVDRHPSFGQEASSRNSEVIHAGIHYAKDSLKAKFCVEGRRRLYAFCQEHNIPHRRLGKLIVATNDAELHSLEGLLEQGRDNGVEDLTLLSRKEVKSMEPNIEAVGALHSPSTGIVDTHKLMKRLESLAGDRGATFAYNCEVISIEKKKEGYEVNLRDADGEEVTLFTRTFINSTGLSSDRIARMVGIDTDKAGYKLYYSKGEYFRVKGKKAGLVNKLIYPPPKNDSLGIHTVMDLQGQLKLGPNAFYTDEINYDIDDSHTKEFYEATKGFLPFIELGDLSPDTAGIRSKLQPPQKPKRDFVICEEKERGLDGFINLIGIESPGLTASLAIAGHVSSMI